MYIINKVKFFIVGIVLLLLGVFFFNLITNYYISSINKYIDKDYTIDSVRTDYLREPLNYYIDDRDTLTNF